MRRWRSILPAVAALLLAASACTTATSRRERIPDGPRPPERPTDPAVPADPTPVPEEAPVDAPPAGAAVTVVRVGVLVDTGSVELGSTGGLSLSTEGRGEVARIPAGTRVVFTPSGAGATAVALGAGGSRRGSWSGLDLPVTVRPQGAGGTLTIKGSPYRGVVLVQDGGRGLTAVNRLDMESYLLGVVPREIGTVTEADLEAAKAQAVAARTYAVNYLGRRSALGFDVYATVADQVYGGVTGENEIVTRAVRGTQGEVMTYGGKPIEAYYHSTCAGQTAAIHEVWNERPVPYLVSVRDVDPSGQAYDRASSRFRWTERWTHEQLVGILNRTLADSVGGRTIREIREMRVLDRTPSGRVRTMRISTDAGDAVVGRDRVRWILTPVRGGILNSSKFDVRLVREGGRVTEIVAEGGGWGHGIGMCQVGAKGRSQAGQDYRTILRTYYPGTRLERLY